jgi:hypothetical protein
MKKPFEHHLMHHYAGRGPAYALASSLILAKIRYSIDSLRRMVFIDNPPALVKMHYYAFQLV